MIKKTERTLLSLRKSQIEEYIMSKRKVINGETSAHCIDPLKLYISEDYFIDIDVFLNNVSKFS